LCGCVSVCMCGLCGCVSVCMCVCVFANVSAYNHVYVSFLCLHAWIYLCMFTRDCECVCMCVCVYAWVCVRVRVRVRVCISHQCAVHG
jgi:hypothetical protein